MNEFAQKEYERWLAHADGEILEELKRIQNDPAEIEAHFGHKQTFGTGGIRSVMGVGIANLNTYTVRQTARGLAAYLAGEPGEKSCAIGYDCRHNSRRFAEICAAALAESGIHVHLYDRLCPTPMLSYAVRHLHCSAGIVISASHNTQEYNGIKCYGPDGCQMTDEPAARVFAEIEKIPYFLPAEKSFEDFLAEGGVEFIAPELWERYYETVLGERLATVPSDNLNLLYTPLCGTGNKPVRTVLGRIGVNVAVVPAQEKPDGDFKTCEYPNPETDAALNESYKIARETHPDLILGTDPDCDRVAVAVPVEGGFRKLSGNELGCLLLDYILGTMQKAGTLPADPVAVRSIVSTPMADKIAASYGVKMRRVLTGFKYIGDIITSLSDAGEVDRFIFGFEESYGYLAGDHVRDKDAVSTSLLICQMAQYYKLQGKNLADAMHELYEKYGYYHNKTISLSYPGAEGAAKMAGIMAGLRENPPAELAGSKIEAVVDYNTCVNGLPKANVIEFDLEGGNKGIVRPSGTEPKIRVMVEGEDMEAIQSSAERIADMIRQRIPGVC